jgi:hypothetical protein
MISEVLRTFSLDYEDSEVQQCASSFLDTNYRLFDETQEAAALGSPTYPKDKEQSYFLEISSFSFC